MLQLRPMHATVTATEAGAIWSLELSSFHRILAQPFLSALTRILREVALLKPLSLSQLQRLAECLEEQEYALLLTTYYLLLTTYYLLLTTY